MPLHQPHTQSPGSKTWHTTQCSSVEAVQQGYCSDCAQGVHRDQKQAGRWECQRALWQGLLGATGTPTPNPCIVGPWAQGPISRCFTQLDAGRGWQAYTSRPSHCSAILSSNSSSLGSRLLLLTSSLLILSLCTMWMSEVAIRVCTRGRLAWRTASQALQAVQ